MLRVERNHRWEFRKRRVSLRAMCVWRVVDVDGPYCVMEAVYIKEHYGGGVLGGGECDIVSGRGMRCTVEDEFKLTGMWT